MIEMIGWFSLVAQLIAIPSITIIGILFHRQRRTKGSLILAFGLITIFIGMVIGLIFPQTFETMEEAEQVITTVGPPLRWFIDDVIHSISMIVTVLGFGLVVFEDKNNA